MILIWGVDNFGIWIFLISVPAMLNFFNFNFTQATVQEMTYFHAKGQVNKVKEIFQNSLVILMLNVLIFTIVILIFYFFSNFNLTIIENLPVKEFNIILLLLILSFYLDIIGNGIMANVLQFQGKLYIEIYINNALDFISKLSIILTGIFFESLIYAALLFFIISILKSIIFIYYYYLNKMYLVFSLRKSSIKGVKKLFKLSLGYSAELLATLMKHSGQIFLLGIFFGPQIIAYVSTCKTLFYFFPVRILATLNNISMFEYAQTFAKKKISNLKYNHKVHILFIIVLLLLFLIASTTIGPFIYKIWLNNKFNLSFIFLLIIAFDASLYLLRTSIIIPLKSLNRFFVLGIVELFFIFIAMLVSYYFLSLGYSFISHFIIILISSVIILLISTYIVDKFYKNYKIN